MAADQPTSSESSNSLQSTLLRGVRAQDPEAWQRLVDLFGPLVYGWCRGQQLQPADASDVTQDVFRAVANNIERFRRERPGDSFRGWLWTITRNKIRDLQRARGKQPHAVGGTTMMHRVAEVPDEPPSEDSSSTDMVRSTYRRAVEMVRERFEEPTWQAFWRVAIERDKPADVAADLGITVNAVRKAKARVLRRLREEFGELLDE
jgi:RNA polymerase sigma-70 factor (ECF subfamily)